MTRLPDGGLQWTTPGGDSITTHPPRYGSDDDLPPPALGRRRRCNGHQAAHHLRTAPPLATTTTRPRRRTRTVLRRPVLARSWAAPVGHDDGVTSLVGEALRQRCIEAVVTEGERFGDRRAGTGLRADRRERRPRRRPSPGCRSGAARDLVGHLGTVHRWATTILRAGSTEPPPPGATQTPPADENLLDWYETGLVELVATLRTTPPDAPAWHMSPAAEKVAASWARRQAHELAVHRMDLEAAAGVAHAPLDPDARRGRRRRTARASSCRAGRTPSRSSSADATVGVTCTDTGRTLVGRASPAVRSPSAAGRSGSEDAHVHGAGHRSSCSTSGADPRDVTVDGDPAAEAPPAGAMTWPGPSSCHPAASRFSAAPPNSSPTPTATAPGCCWSTTPRSRTSTSTTPTHLEFEYVRRIGHVLDLAAEPGAAIDVVHLGGGALTLPRYVAVDPAGLSAARRGDRPAAHRPRPRSTSRSPAAPGSGSAPTTPASAWPRCTPAAPTSSSATSSPAPAPPRHLTSAEFAADVHRVLRPGGVYAANVADGPPLRFARGQVATLRSVFRHVCLLAEPGTLRGRRFGNLVAVALGRRTADRRLRPPLRPRPDARPRRPRRGSGAVRRHRPTGPRRRGGRLARAPRRRLQPLSAASNAASASSENSTNRTSVTCSTTADRTPATACRAASSSGQP